MTATMNIGAETIRIHRTQMPLLLQLHTTGAVGVDAATERSLDDLTGAGLLQDGALHPMTAAILEGVSAAPLVVSAERMRLGDVATSTIWASPLGAVIGSRVDGEQFELKLASSRLLPFHLFQLIHLRPLPTPPELDVTVGAAALAEAEALVAAGDRQGACELLSDDAPGANGSIAAVLANRVATWRVHSVWSASGGAQMREAAGMDCGPAGHYLARATSDGESISIRGASFRDVLAEVRATLP